MFRVPFDLYQDWLGWFRVWDGRVLQVGAQTWRVEPEAAHDFFVYSDAQRVGIEAVSEGLAQTTLGRASLAVVDAGGEASIAVRARTGLSCAAKAGKFKSMHIAPQKVRLWTRGLRSSA